MRHSVHQDAIQTFGRDDNVHRWAPIITEEPSRTGRDAIPHQKSLAFSSSFSKASTGADRPERSFHTGRRSNLHEKSPA